LEIYDKDIKSLSKSRETVLLTSSTLKADLCS
jgi:hypothetical protein